MPDIRPPAVAGMFYPADPAELTGEIQQFISRAHFFDLTPGRHEKDATPGNETHHARPPLSNFPPPARAADMHAGERANERLREFNVKALIVPHAGYLYSGAIAATAYATLRAVAHKIRRVVLLGPTHRVAVRGLALPGVDAFDTPLGRIMIDSAAVNAILHLPQVVTSRSAHAQEHSLEVQLPFLQSVLDHFTLLPLAVGMATAQEVAEVLEALWGKDETLIVISSDLSHYLPYSTCQRADQETVQAIVNLQQPIPHDRACGGTPISGLMIAARHHHLSAHLLDLRNSGDTAGTQDEVVGYAAIAFTEETHHAN